MKNNNKSKLNSKKILLSLSFGVFVYSIYQLFSGAPTTGTYVGSIILASIMFFMSLTLLGFESLENKNVQRVKKPIKQSLDERVTNLETRVENLKERELREA